MISEESLNTALENLERIWETQEMAMVVAGKVPDDNRFLDITMEHANHALSLVEGMDQSNEIIGIMAITIIAAIIAAVVALFSAIFALWDKLFGGKSGGKSDKKDKKKKKKMDKGKNVPPEVDEETDKQAEGEASKYEMDKRSAKEMMRKIYKKSLREAWKKREADKASVGPAQGFDSKEDFQVIIEYTPEMSTMVYADYLPEFSKNGVNALIYVGALSAALVSHSKVVMSWLEDYASKMLVKQQQGQKLMELITERPRGQDWNIRAMVENTSNGIDIYQMLSMTNVGTMDVNVTGLGVEIEVSRERKVYGILKIFPELKLDAVQKRQMTIRDKFNQARTSDRLLTYDFSEELGSMAASAEPMLDHCKQINDIVHGTDIPDYTKNNIKTVIFDILHQIKATISLTEMMVRILGMLKHEGYLDPGMTPKISHQKLLDILDKAKWYKEAHKASPELDVGTLHAHITAWYDGHTTVEKYREMTSVLTALQTLWTQEVGYIGFFSKVYLQHLNRIKHYKEDSRGPIWKYWALGELVKEAIDKATDDHVSTESAGHTYGVLTEIKDSQTPLEQFDIYMESLHYLDADLEYLEKSQQIGQYSPEVLAGINNNIVNSKIPGMMIIPEGELSTEFIGTAILTIIMVIVGVVVAIIATIIGFFSAIFDGLTGGGGGGGASYTTTSTSKDRAKRNNDTYWSAKKRAEAERARRDQYNRQRQAEQERASNYSNSGTNHTSYRSASRALPIDEVCRTLKNDGHFVYKFSNKANYVKAKKGIPNTNNVVFAAPGRGSDRVYQVTLRTFIDVKLPRYFTSPVDTIGEYYLHLSRTIETLEEDKAQAIFASVGILVDNFELLHGKIMDTIDNGPVEIGGAKTRAGKIAPWMGLNLKLDDMDYDGLVKHKVIGNLKRVNRTNGLSSGFVKRSKNLPKVMLSKITCSPVTPSNPLPVVKDVALAIEYGKEALEGTEEIIKGTTLIRDMLRKILDKLEEISKERLEFMAEYAAACKHVSKYLATIEDAIEKNLPASEVINFTDYLKTNPFSKRSMEDMFTTPSLDALAVDLRLYGYEAERLADTGEAIKLFITYTKEHSALVGNAMIQLKKYMEDISESLDTQGGVINNSTAMVMALTGIALHP